MRRVSLACRFSARIEDRVHMKTVAALALGAFLSTQPVHSSGGLMVINAKSPSGLSILEGLRLSGQGVILAGAGEIIQINRVSVVFVSDQALVLIDPVGPQSQYARFGRPDIVVLTNAHPDHLSIDTMIGLLRRDTIVLAPQTVIDQLPLMISNNVIAPFEAGATQVVDAITFTAVTGGSDAPDGAQALERARGDIGVVMEVDATRLYF